MHSLGCLIKSFTIWPITTPPGKLNHIFPLEAVFDWVAPSVVPMLCMRNSADDTYFMTFIVFAPPGRPLVSPASWACSLCSHTEPFSQKGPELGVMFCYRHPEMLSNCWTRDTSFSFCMGHHTLCSWSFSLNSELFENRSYLLLARNPSCLEQRTPSTK